MQSVKIDVYTGQATIVFGEAKDAKIFINLQDRLEFLGSILVAIEISFASDFANRPSISYQSRDQTRLFEVFKRADSFSNKSIVRCTYDVEQSVGIIEVSSREMAQKTLEGFNSLLDFQALMEYPSAPLI